MGLWSCCCNGLFCAKHPPGTHRIALPASNPYFDHQSIANSESQYMLLLWVDPGSQQWIHCFWRRYVPLYAVPYRWQKQTSSSVKRPSLASSTLHWNHLVFCLSSFASFIRFLCFFVNPWTLENRSHSYWVPFTVINVRCHWPHHLTIRDEWFLVVVVWSTVWLIPVGMSITLKQVIIMPYIHDEDFYYVLLVEKRKHSYIAHPGAIEEGSCWPLLVLLGPWTAYL